MDSVRILTAGILLSAAISAGAVVSRQHPVEVAAPDGRMVTVTAIGDEHSRIYVDADGNSVDWISSAGGQKSFVPSRILAERRNEQALSQAPFHITTFPTTGERRFLVILVEFANMSFATPAPHAEFNNLFNTDGYDTLGGTGSVAEYYRYCSGGLFEPCFDVVGPVKLSQGYAYYGGGSDDSQAGCMVVEACTLIDYIVNFADYDLDGDGEVDSVYFIYAGKGEADGGDPDTIWPHSWNLSDQRRELTLDGVAIQGYACSPELDGSAKLNGMGTPCHEFAHVLGLPDLYCTNSYVSCLHPGEWSLMASGNYNNDGRTPPMLSVYERYELGWVNPQELSFPLSVTMHQSDASAPTSDVYRISTERTNEYFLFENRQQTGWDTYLPGHGMLVWHIDYNPNIWDRNRVNATPEHQYVDIVEANNATSANQGSGFTFPGTSRVTSFTSSTRPALKSWAGVPIDLPVTAIAEHSDGSVTFNVAGGKTPVGVPSDIRVSDIGMDQFTVSWTAATAAEGHRIRVSDLEVVDVQGDAHSVVIGNLWPGNTYQVEVCGYDRWQQGAWSEPVSVVMPEPTFDYLKVVSYPAADITGNSFTAAWECLDDAVEYKVEVMERTEEGGHEVTCDFTGKQLPDGFETNSNTWVSIAGYFGDSAPALRLNNDGDYLLSPIFASPVSRLSFVYRGSNVDDNAQIVVEASDGSDHFNIIAVAEVETQSRSFSITAMPDGVRQLRLRFAKNGKATVSIDDVCMVYGATVTDTPVYSGIVPAPVSSVVVTGLMPQRHYFYTVTAHSADGTSSISSTPMHFITIEGGDSGLTPQDLPEETGPWSLYDLCGRCVASGTFTGTPALPYAFSGLSSGVYILRSGTATRKVFIP